MMDKETAQLTMQFLTRVDLKWNEQQAAAKVTNALFAILKEAEAAEIRAQVEVELLKKDTAPDKERGPYEPLSMGDLGKKTSPYMKDIIGEG